MKHNRVLARIISSCEPGLGLGCNLQRIHIYTQLDDRIPVLARWKICILTSPIICIHLNRSVPLESRTAGVCPVPCRIADAQGDL